MRLTHAILIVLLCVILSPSTLDSQVDEQEALIASVGENGISISSIYAVTSPIITFDDIDLFGGDPEKWWLLSPETMQLSPDGRVLALSVARPESFRIVIVELLTGSRRDITVPYPATILWSPDSDVIFINRFRNLYVEQVYTNTDAVPGIIYNYDSAILTTLSIGAVHDALWMPDNNLMFIEEEQDIYRVSQDGSNLQRLTDIEVSGKNRNSICGPLAYQPSNQRIYFSGTCNLSTQPYGSVFSVADDGNELRLESQLDEISMDEHITGVDFPSVEAISVFRNELYVAFDAYVYSNSSSRRSWRIIRVNDNDANEVIFTYRLGSQFSSIIGSLEISSFSPTGEYVALAGLNQLIVADINTDMILLDAEYPDEMVCSFRWQDNVNLLYTTSNRCSREVHNAGSVSDIPGAVYSFNVETQTIDTVATDNAWIVPIGFRYND